MSYPRPGMVFKLTSGREDLDPWFILVLGGGASYYRRRILWLVVGGDRSVAAGDVSEVPLSWFRDKSIVVRVV